MATQVPPTTASTFPFTSKAELDLFITETVSKAMGPALTDAFAPLSAKQKSAMDEMLDISKRQEQRSKPNSEKGLMFARHARAMFLGSNDVERAIFEVKRQWGADDPVLRGLEGSLKLKGLTAGNASAAGNIVIPEWSREFIELLRNQTVVRGLPGIRTLPMPAGALGIRKQTGAGTAYYVGEALNITASTQAVGTLQMIWRKLAAMTVLSNDLLRFAGPEADAFVRDDLLLISALREDLAFLLGDGTANTPVGILNWTAAASKFLTAGTSLANTQADLAKLIRKLQEGNVPLTPDNGVFIMAPRTYWGIYNLTTTTGDYVFAPEMRTGRLMGYQFRVSNQIPITANVNGLPDASGATSYIFFVHTPSLVIGESLNVQVDFFQNGTYYDGAAVVSGISTDESVLRVLREHDFVLRHDVGAAIDYGVTIA